MRLSAAATSCARAEWAPSCTTSGRRHASTSLSPSQLSSELERFNAELEGVFGSAVEEGGSGRSGGGRGEDGRHGGGAWSAEEEAPAPSRPVRVVVDAGSASGTGTGPPIHVHFHFSSLPEHGAPVRVELSVRVEHVGQGVTGSSAWGGHGTAGAAPLLPAPPVEERARGPRAPQGADNSLDD